LTTGGDLVDLVDEHHGVLQLRDLEEPGAQRSGQPCLVSCEPRGVEFDERPSQSAGDRAGEGRLAGARRPEQHRGSRGANAQLLGQVRMRERQDEPGLDQLLLGRHPGQGLPQSSRQERTAEFAQRFEVGTMHGDPALEVSQRDLGREFTVLERLQPSLRLRQERGDAEHPARRESCLEPGQQCAPDALVTVGRVLREQHDPRPVSGNPGDRCPDHASAVGDDHPEAVVAGGDDLRQGVDRVRSVRRPLSPHTDDSLEVFGSVVT
jgi:hypothetical protein